MVGGNLLSKQDLNKALRELCNKDVSVAILSKSDEHSAIDVLTDAFMLDDPLFVWMAQLDEKDQEEKKRKMHKIVKYFQSWVNIRLISGRRGVAVGIHDDNNKLIGCMTLAPSSCQKERMLDTFISVIQLGSPPMYKSKHEYGEHSQKRLERSKVIATARTKHMEGTGKWIYVQSIGVVPNEAGKGYGKRMMQLLIRTADSLKVPIYLETESEGNESMYHHFGFKTLEKLDVCVPDDTSPTAHLTMYLMRKDA